MNPWQVGGLAIYLYVTFALTRVGSRRVALLPAFLFSAVWPIWTSLFGIEYLIRKVLDGLQHAWRLVRG